MHISDRNLTNISTRSRAEDIPIVAEPVVCQRHLSDAHVARGGVLAVHAEDGVRGGGAVDVDEGVNHPSRVVKRLLRKWGKRKDRENGLLGGNNKKSFSCFA